MAQTSNKRYTLYISSVSDGVYTFDINIGDAYEDNIMYLFLNNKHFRRDPQITKKKSFAINIVIHSADDLLNGQPSKEDAVYDFAQEFLTLKGDSKNQPCPIIHITLVDAYVDALFGNENLPLLIPRSFQIMDSSIWNYLVPMFDINFRNAYGEVTEIEKFQDVFYKAVDSIYENYKKHLYNLHVAKEYADLNARLITEAYLSGAHAKGVSPFIFHSENVIEKMIKDEFIDNDNVIEKIKGRKWRLLLVDDKACKEMEPKDIFLQDKDKYGFPWNCKIRIICELLVKLFDLKDDNVRARKAGTEENLSDCIILIDYVEDVDSAKDALKRKEYDLILLDYLLDNHEYGYQLLEDIYKQIDKIDPLVDDLRKRYNEIKDYIPEKKQKEICEIWQDLNSREPKYKPLLNYIEEDKTLKSIYIGNLELEKKLTDLFKGLCKYKIGPCDRYFFMFISAYSSAVHDRLLAEGLNPSEKYWYINLGACPTNTPQLFLYNLLKLMEKRLEDSHLNRLSIDGIMDDLNLIFGEEGKERTNASEQYYKIQSYQYYFRSLLKDYDITVGNENLFKTSQSVLITHFLNDHINMGGLLEHLAQLVHLTGFGTIRQWPEMWEEYLYIKVQLEALIDGDENKKEKDEKEKKKLEDLCHHIENYIKKLKSSAL